MPIPHRHGKTDKLLATPKGHPCNRSLIVGAGPVGLTMAAELARYGVQPRLIDRSPHPTETF